MYFDKAVFRIDEKGDAIPFNLTGKKRSSIASELEDLPLSPIKKIKVEEEKTP